MTDYSEILTTRTGWESADYMPTVNQINRLLSKYGLSVNEVVSAPTVMTYKANLNVDTKINSILRMENNFAIATNDVYTRVYQDGNQLCIETTGANNTVLISDLYNEDFAKADKSKLLMMIGIDTNCEKVYYDLTKAPHMMISGTTGSGKSILVLQIIFSLLMNHLDDIEIIGIDAKGTEFKCFEIVKNFTFIDDTNTAIQTLHDLCVEMDERYATMQDAGVRDIDSYNERGGVMCHKVCIIDEFADLMLVSGSQVEDYVVRLAQKARACGIHLVIATQSPRKDILTGLIQANIPTRISLAVNDNIESRIAIGRKGAEKLMGKGDMLFLANGQRNPIRVQGAYVNEYDKLALLNSFFIEQYPDLANRPDKAVTNKDKENSLDHIKTRIWDRFKGRKG